MKPLKYFILITFLILFSCDPPNNRPTIIGLDYDINDPNGDGAIIGGSPVVFTCNAIDEEGDQIIYNWRATGGYFNSTSTVTVTWTSPVNTQTNEDLLWEVYEIYCDVTDDKHMNQVQTIRAIIFTLPPERCVRMNFGTVTITNDHWKDIYVDCRSDDNFPNTNSRIRLRWSESTTYEMTPGLLMAWAITVEYYGYGGTWTVMPFNLGQCEIKNINWSEDNLYYAPGKK
ncbi:MAG: hypothetical protein JXB49_23485 [Bacteroidales bacterium]|nr:hypothetical protein [Bacteroidales bacterium]